MSTKFISIYVYIKRQTLNNNKLEFHSFERIIVLVEITQSTIMTGRLMEHVSRKNTNCFFNAENDSFTLLIK